MTKYFFFLCCFFLPIPVAWSQKTYTAARLEAAPRLDGVADDSCWQQITPAEIALTSTPVFGLPALPATVRLFYTRDALYIAATFSGSAPRRDGSQRDDTGPADWFSVGLDTWRDGQNAFVFTVTAGGMQSEKRVGSNETLGNWDAVWQSAVAQQADGWSVEIRLPFTALRYPTHDVQQWGLQFSRFDRRSGVLSTWSPQRPLIQDEVLQYGALEGLQDIHQRQRLSAAVHGRLTQAYSKEGQLRKKMGQGLLGVDGRWGFCSNTTLEVALLPGTTIDLPARDLYYIPFEKKYLKILHRRNAWLPEPRQLLAEEQPLFDKGGILLEYPLLRQQVVKLGFGEYLVNYNDSEVWSTAKFTSRLPGNVAVGVYSVLLGPSSALVRLYSDPGSGPLETRQLTGTSNYTLLTVEKALANNSWLSLSNASMWGQQPFHNNLSALAFQLRERSNRYQMTGRIQMNVSEVNDTIYRPNSQYYFSLGKVNGTWTWLLAHDRSKQLSADILNSDPAYYPFAGAYADNTLARLGYHDFQSHGWQQNTEAALQLSKKWQEQAQRFNPLTLTADYYVQNQQFQKFTLFVRSELEKKLRTYRFDSDFILDRQVSPYTYTSLAFRSDNRKKFNYEASVGGGGNWGGESGYLGSSLSLQWAMSRRFRLDMTTGLSTERADNAVQDLPVPGYYVRQFNAVRFNNTLKISWFCTPTFNLFAQLAREGTKFHRESVLQVTGGNELTPVNFPIVPMSRLLSRQIVLGGQWFFAPLSQLRFQFVRYPDNTVFIFDDNHFFPISYRGNGVPSGASASLSFIYSLDGNRKRRL